MRPKARFLQVVLVAGVCALLQLASPVNAQWPGWLPFRPPWVQPDTPLSIQGIPYQQVERLGGGATGQGFVYQVDPAWQSAQQQQQQPRGRRRGQMPQQPPQRVFVKKYYGPNPEAYQREVNGLQRMGSLVHHEIDPRTGAPVIVQPLIDGQRLDTAIKQAAQYNPAEVPSLRAGFQQAVADFHRGGYVHGDLTPENVMYNPKTGRYTVIDLEAMRDRAKTPRNEFRARQQREQVTGLAAFDSIAYGAQMMRP